MKRSIRFFLCGLSILVFIGSCKDMEITLERTPHDHSLLNIDGFYYSRLKGDNAGIISIYFFYENGVVLAAGGVRTDYLSSVVHYANNVVDDDFSMYQYVWGVYKVQGGGIEIERYHPHSGGPHKTVIWRGDVLDTSSFILTNGFSNYENESFTVSDRYDFYKFDSKPDSTNNFIK